MPGLDEFFRRVRDSDKVDAAEAFRRLKAEALREPSGPVVYDRGEVRERVVDPASVETRARRGPADVPAVPEVPPEPVPTAEVSAVADEEQARRDYESFLRYKMGPRLPWGARKAQAIVAGLSGGRGRSGDLVGFKSHVRELVEEDWRRRVDGG